jgi:nucleoside-diphosphate-sugar epimerase
MRVLVTGATGFVGINFVHALLKTKHEPVALVRPSSPSYLLPDNVEIIEGNITDPKSIKSAVETVQAVVHFAAVRSGYTGTIKDWHQLDWNRLEAVNINGTKNLIEASENNGVEQFVFSSTFLAHPNFMNKDRRDYVQSKANAGNLLTDNNHSFSYTILHPTYIIGPQDYRLSRLGHFWRVRSNPILAPPLYIPGERNIVDVRDVAASAVYGLEEDENARYFVTGENFESKAFHKRISSVTGSSCRVISIPSAISKYVLAPLADVLHTKELFPVEGDWFRKRTEDGVPEGYEYRAPVNQQSADQLIRDTYDWYADVGVL